MNKQFGRIIFLLEEPSMKVLLEGLLPRLFPDWVIEQHFLCVSHEGKSDLEKSIERKLKAWHYPNDKFVIVRDTDNADCLAIKKQLENKCSLAKRPDTLIRLVCQELESWYLGDLAALAIAFNDAKINSPAHAKRFSQPDTWQKPSVQVKRLAPLFRKISDARVMSQCLHLQRNQSPSFRVFITGVQRLKNAMDSVV